MESAHIPCALGPRNTRGRGYLCSLCSLCSHRVGALALLSAVPLPSPNRLVPDSFDDRQRLEFLEISTRVKAELCASFTLVAVGLQLYLNQSSMPNLEEFAADDDAGDGIDPFLAASV